MFLLSTEPYTEQTAGNFVLLNTIVSFLGMLNRLKYIKLTKINIKKNEKYIFVSSMDIHETLF